MSRYVLAAILLSYINVNIATAANQDGTAQGLRVFADSYEWSQEEYEKTKQIIEFWRKHEKEFETLIEPSTVGSAKPQHTYNVSREHNTAIDSWSIVWYVASFGGLIIFFLVVSCSEWCCKRPDQSQSASAIPALPQMGQSSSITESPPPSYDLFAPPSYESLHMFENEKNLFDIYVVPVHAIRPMVEDQPPEYTSSITIQPDNHHHELSSHSHA